ncbi:hypothetical protein JCM15765_42220 [Paradesulfitobacterium aromaticivorans]
MARVVAINRKYFSIGLSILVIFVLSFAAVTVWQTIQASAAKNSVVPELKMLSLTVEPSSVVKDMTYGTVTLKGSQVIPAKSFDLIATVQNTTAQKMTNIPIELDISLIGDDKQKIIKPGTLDVLEPGATARVSFRQIKALGDALGKSATAGQHMIVLRIKTNPAGGVTQTTEASFRFNVDSTVKPVPQKQ